MWLRLPGRQTVTRTNRQMPGKVIPICRYALNGTKKGISCLCWAGHSLSLRNVYMASELDRMSIFFRPPAYLWAVTYMTGMWRIQLGIIFLESLFVFICRSGETGHMSNETFQLQLTRGTKGLVVIHIQSCTCIRQTKMLQKLIQRNHFLERKIDIHSNFI